MNQEYSLLCRRYATAFLNVYGDKISLEDCKVLRSAGDFLGSHRSILAFFELPDLRPDRHQQMIDLLVSHFSLPEAIKPLLFLLEKQRQLWLLVEVLFVLVELYLQRNNLMIFSVESFPVLSSEKLEDFKKFLHRQTKKDILCRLKENKDLIAGIRAQSSSLLWEYSIEKKLREARHVIHEQG
jgi:F0F1-type ATP synthase delta subunit